MSSSVLRSVLMTASALLSSSALADGPYVLNTDESGGSKNAWTDSTKWNDSNGNPLTTWDADGDYVVSGNLYLRSPNTGSGQQTFNANSLKIGSGTSKALSLRPCACEGRDDEKASGGACRTGSGRTPSVR